MVRRGRRQRAAGIDDAGSGHASSIEANAMPTLGSVISGAWQHRRGGFMSGRRRASLHETTAQSVNARCAWANVGWISCSARIHDANSGHAPTIEANAVPTSIHKISAIWPHRTDGFERAAGGRHFKKPQRNLPSSSAFGATSVGSLDLLPVRLALFHA